MYKIGDKLVFSSRTEAKFAILSKIEDALGDRTLDNDLKRKLTLWREQIQQSIDNHSKDLDHLLTFYTGLSADERTRINQHISTDLLTTFKESPYDLMDMEIKFKDYLVRAYEGTLPSILLLNPTPEMRESTLKISNKIISNLEFYLANNFQHDSHGTKNDYTNEFKTLALNFMAHVPDTMYTGGLTLEEVNAHLQIKGIPLLSKDAKSHEHISVAQARAILELGVDALKKNDNLERVVSLHFRFALRALRAVPMVSISEHEPTGKPKAMLSAKYGSDYAKFYDDIRLPGDQGFKARKFISDDQIYNSPYYTVEPEKGRQGRPDFTRTTSSYGIFLEDDFKRMSASNPQHLITPRNHAPWAPDAVCQDANMVSNVVKSSLEHEAAYVSGPSGTYSLLTGLQEVLTNPQDDKERQIYLQAMLAYIVGTGLHSVHEVLGPAAHLMNLIPGYATAVPSFSNPIPAPCFNAFYQLACQNDKDFHDRLEEAWQRVTNFYREVYTANPVLININAEDIFVKAVEEFFRGAAGSEANLRAIEYLLKQNVYVNTFSDPFGEKLDLLCSAFNQEKSLFSLLIQSPTVPDSEEKRLLSTLFHRMQAVEAENQPEHFNLQYDAEKKCIYLVPSSYYDDPLDSTIHHDLNLYEQEINAYMHRLGLRDFKWQASPSSSSFSTNFYLMNQKEITEQLLSPPAATVSETQQRGARITPLRELHKSLDSAAAAAATVAKQQELEESLERLPVNKSPPSPRRS